MVVVLGAQEYYANTGALKRAAENARTDGGKVGVSIVEAFGKQARTSLRCSWCLHVGRTNRSQLHAALSWSTNVCFTARYFEQDFAFATV